MLLLKYTLIKRSCTEKWHGEEGYCTIGNFDKRKVDEFLQIDFILEIYDFLSFEFLNLELVK